MELTEKKILPTNDLAIVGKLVEVKEVKEGAWTSAEGTEMPFVSTKIVVKVTDNESNEHLIELQSFTNKFRKSDGGESKLYSKMLDIDSMLDKRISIRSSKDFANGRIEENRFYSPNKKDVVNFTRFNYTSLFEAYKTDTSDFATFKYSGFVTKELELVEDAEGNPLHYAINIAQPRYGGENLDVTTFIVEKDNVAAAKVIQEHYKKFKSVEVAGVFKTEMVERKAEPVAPTGFGEVAADTLPPLVYRHLVITGGSMPFNDDPDNKHRAHSDEEIKSLLISYKEKGEAIKKAGEEAAASSAAPVAANAGSGKPKLSLDDLI